MDRRAARRCLPGCGLAAGRALHRLPLRRRFPAAPPYYESIDLIDAFHPQTILAYGMNDTVLPIGHGAPLRLRVERQLGYKHAKYIMRIEAVDSLASIGRGKRRLLGGRRRLRVVRRDLSQARAAARRLQLACTARLLFRRRQRIG